MKVFTLFDAAAADGDSETVELANDTQSVFFAKTTGETVGLTLTLYCKSPAGDWHAFHTAEFTTAANHPPIVFNVEAPTVKATISGRTAGSLTLSVRS